MQKRHASLPGEAAAPGGPQERTSARRPPPPRLGGGALLAVEDGVEAPLEVAQLDGQHWLSVHVAGLWGRSGNEGHAGAAQQFPIERPDEIIQRMRWGAVFAIKD